jgi:hypothetical protein
LHGKLQTLVLKALTIFEQQSHEQQQQQGGSTDRVTSIKAIRETAKKLGDSLQSSLELSNCRLRLLKDQSWTYTWPAQEETYSKEEEKKRFEGLIRQTEKRTRLAERLVTQAILRGEDIHEVKRRRHTVRYLESCKETLETQLQAVKSSIRLEWGTVRMMKDYLEDELWVGQSDDASLSV